MAEQRLPDLRSGVAELKRHLVMVMADEQRLYQRYVEATREAERWRRRAELAVHRGIDDLSRAALERSEKHAVEAARYHEEYLEQKQYVERLKARLLELEIRARERTTLSGPVDTSAVERGLAYLDRWEDRAREARARVAARAELERDEVGDRLAELEREDRLERQLAELKKRVASSE